VLYVEEYVVFESYTIFMICIYVHVTCMWRFHWWVYLGITLHLWYTFIVYIKCMCSFHWWVYLGITLHLW